MYTIIFLTIIFYLTTEQTKPNPLIKPKKILTKNLILYYCIPLKPLFYLLLSLFLYYYMYAPMRKHKVCQFLYTHYKTMLHKEKLI